MCGIFGYMAYGENRPSVDELNLLAVASQARGTDASGIAWIHNDGTLRVYKGPKPSRQMLKKGVLHKLFPNGLPNIIVGHTRAQTKGHPRNNNNNHPLIDKNKGVALVHNGIIRNDDILFNEQKLERLAQVDSEIILRLWNASEGTDKQKIQKVAGELEGSFAVAMLDTASPNKLILFKHNNPINLWWNESAKVLWFASTEGILVDSVGHNTGPLPWIDNIIMNKDSYLILEIGKDSRHGSFKSYEDKVLGSAGHRKRDVIISDNYTDADDEFFPHQWQQWQGTKFNRDNINKKTQGESSVQYIRGTIHPIEEECSRGCLCQTCWSKRKPNFFGL